MRVLLSLWLGLAVLVGCRTCIDADVPRNYLCTGDGGPAECPGGWQCNTAWGYCFDPDAGASVPCRQDSDCGGGWRCTPDGLCADPSTEGEVSTVETSAPEPVRPVLFNRASLQLASASPLEGTGPRGPTVDLAVAGRLEDAGLEVLAVHADFEPEGERYWTAYGHVPVGAQDFALSLAPGAGGADLFIWTVAGGRLRVQRPGSAQTEPPSVPQTCTWVAPLRTAGALPPALVGAVQVRYANGLALVSPGGQPLLNVPSASAQELLWLGDPVCADGPLGLVARTSAIEAYRILPDAGLALVGALDAGRPVDFRVVQQGGRTFVAWRAFTGGAGGERTPSMAEVSPLCGDAGVVQVRTLERPACPTGAFVGYDLSPNAVGPPDFVTECVVGDPTNPETLTDLVFVGERATPVAYLPPRIVSRDSQTVFSRFIDAQLTTGPNLLDQSPLTLPEPPETLLLSPDGGVQALTRTTRFARAPWGFVAERLDAWEGLPASYVEDCGLTVARSGVVTLGDDVVALPEEAWSNPAAWVLADVLEQRDGGHVLVATHDDAFDVAELEDESPTLVTRLRPSPATPILSLALQPARDGGTAEGYLVAGLGLFEVRASTPRRWSAAPVSLSGLRPVFTWFDRGRPRALLDDGTVLGLVTRVPLSNPLEDGEEVRAGGALCGAPFALTSGGLYRLEPPAPGEARARWAPVALPGVTPRTNFSSGRLVTLQGELYVFANAGTAWVLRPASGCPTP